MLFKPSTVFDCALNSAGILKERAQNLIVTLAWTARNVFQSFRYILEMYTFTLSESQKSVTLKCRIIALFLKRSVFLKHDFDVYLYGVVSSARTLHFHPFFSLNNCSKATLAQPIFDEHTSDSSPGETTKYDYIGGGRQLVFSFDELAQYALTGITEKQYKFVQCLDKDKAYNKASSNSTLIICNIPLSTLAPRLTFNHIKNLALLHNVHIAARLKVNNAQMLLQSHICQNCDSFMAIFEPYNTSTNAERSKGYRNAHKTASAAHDKVRNKTEERKMLNRKTSRNSYWASQKVEFPPLPLSSELSYTIASDFSYDTSPHNFVESGCAVCAKLTPIAEMQELSIADGLNLNVLEKDGVTRTERLKSSDPHGELKGPILADNCQYICTTCAKSVSKNQVPLFALANGLWLGNIPEALQNLSYAEQLLIARVRHNRCIIRVSSGMHKMKANAISFANPMPKIYNILPPPADEMDDVLAFIYTGPCKPTKAEFERTPLLVRRNKVANALEWLKLNHVDYFDLEISQKNLDTYPEDGPSVVVDYRQSETNKDPEATSLHDNDDEDGTEEGPCPFTVHGLAGEEFSTKSIKEIKSLALQHLTSEGKVLGIGHAEQPESIYANPQLFPQMLPWLFPYGMGGIEQPQHRNKLSTMMHKRHLLMYHDKRFQTDPHFPLIAFNHEQIKKGTTGGYLLAERQSFRNITDRLLNVNTEVLQNLSKRMSEGERVKPETDEEKLCFDLINDLHHVNGHVQGSITQKKYMRNEIWSLISYLGAPSWFITFSPADNMHPISLYYADTDEKFSPELRPYNDRYRLISQNPVAGARFFHFMVEMFIKHVLGVGTDHPGLYGHTAGYYGAVEQQGRLTLHLHLLLYLKGSLTPQEIRDKIMDPTSDFQQKLVEYLESVHSGEFMTGSMNEVKAKVDLNVKENKDYKDSVQTLPEPPPDLCPEPDCEDELCVNCKNLSDWWNKFEETVDDLLLRSNVHNCRTSIKGDEKRQKKERKGCLNAQGNCKARFPRELFKETQVDPKTGALNVKKGEEWVNTFTVLLTYLLRSNSDVTSLLSGTAIKAIVAYISDYVTKPGLKTYSIFDTITGVLQETQN